MGLFQSRGEQFYLESHSSEIWNVCKRLQQVILEMSFKDISVPQEGKLGPWLVEK